MTHAHSDLVKRLRERKVERRGYDFSRPRENYIGRGEFWDSVPDSLCQEAADLIEALTEPPDPESLTIEDYELAFADHRRLVREIDVRMNGNKAAKQASLCDLWGQVKELINDRARLVVVLKEVENVFQLVGRRECDLLTQIRQVLTGKPGTKP